MKIFVLFIWICISTTLFILGTETVQVIIAGINGVAFLFWLTHITTPEDIKKFSSKHSSNNIHGPQV